MDPIEEEMAWARLVMEHQSNGTIVLLPQPVVNMYPLQG